MLDMKQEIGTEIKQELVGFEDRGALRAVCRCIRRIFNVASGINRVLLCKGDGSWKEMTLEELLPMGFGKENL